MANYSCEVRSNYFQVKDHESFNKFCKRWQLDSLGRDRKDGLVGFTPIDPEGITSTPIDEHGEPEEASSDFAKELASQLSEDSVAVWMEVGHEKIRYLIGQAFAVNSKGKVESICLSEVYKKAKKLTKKPEEVTLCEW